MRKLKLHDPSKFDYETKVESILRDSEESMSVRDIRTELTYRDNGLEPSEDYTIEDMEEQIQNIVEELEVRNTNDELDGELSRQPVVYKIDANPAEIEEAETRYKII